MMLCLLAFSGCGIEGSSNVQAIKFLQDVYYVDLNESRFLDYKVYPSTSSDYVASFALGNDYITESKYFEFNNGTVKVISDKFTSIVVNVRINELSDSCEVRLREYPSNISFENSSYQIAQGSVQTLQVKGLFEEGEKLCDSEQFNYKVTSSNPSVIEVIDQSRLLVSSTGRSGVAEISVEILNGQGESKNLKTKTNFVVQKNIDSSFATFGNNVIKDNDILEISCDENEKFIINARYFDTEMNLLKNSGFNIFLSNQNVAFVSEENSQKYIVLSGEGQVKITLISTGIKQDGLPEKITFTLKVHFSEP